jgi:hypothetical protein
MVVITGYPVIIVVMVVVEMTAEPEVLSSVRSDGMITLSDCLMI